MEIDDVKGSGGNKVIQDQNEGGIVGRKVTLPKGIDSVDSSWKDDELKRVFAFVIEEFVTSGLNKCEAVNGKITLHYESGLSHEISNSNLQVNQPLTINFVSNVKISSQQVGRWDGLKKIFAGIFRALFGSSERVKKEGLSEEKAKAEAAKLDDMDNWNETLDLKDSSKLRGVDWLKQTLYAWNQAYKIVHKEDEVDWKEGNEEIYGELRFEDGVDVGFKIDEKLQKYKEDVAKAKTHEQIHDLTTKFYKNVVMKEFMKGLNKQEKQEFVKEVEMQMGMSVPKIIENEFEIGSVGVFGQTIKVKERLENIPIDLSIAYLELKGGREETVNYMKAHSQGIRPSRLKGDKRFQGMPVNLRHHTVQVGDKVVHSLRSGAFAVHDKTIPVELHEDFVVAQALPKVIKGIELIVGDPSKLKIAMEKGSFLYHEQSYMSDMDKSEAEMIKDVQLALKTLGDHLQIRFSNSEKPGLTMDEHGKMIYTMAIPEGGMEGVYSVTTIFTTHSVNEKQAFGQLRGKKNVLQNKINEEAMNRLMAYNGDEISSIQDHYSRSVHAIDYKGMDLIQEEVEKLGGITGKMCKSGKDRTACGVVRSVVENCDLVEDQKKQLRRGLFHGVSHVVTGQNTGKPSAYALNSFQMGVGEHGHKPGNFFPPRHLCASVQT